MKKLILIFSLLLSSLNVSAVLLSETEIVKDGSVAMMFGDIDENLQESLDTYNLYVDYNAQQEKDNPTGPRVSETLLTQVKNVVMYDAVLYAIKQTYIAAVKRNPTIKQTEKPSVKDIANGMLATREIIGPIPNNPLFNAADFERMSIAVNKYFNSPVDIDMPSFVRVISGFYSDFTLEVSGTQNPENLFGIVASIITSLSLKNCEVNNNMCLSEKLDVYFESFIEMNNSNKARRLAGEGTNILSTFYTNQNAVQSTCLGGGSCAAPVGGM